MRSWYLILLATMSIVLYQNCSGRHESWEGQHGGSSFGNTNNPISIAAYQKNLYPIMTESTRCVRCHATTQQPLHSQLTAAFSHDVLISFSLVNLSTPAQSRIVTKIRGGHNGFPTTLATQLENAIQAWANDIVANGGTIGTPPGVLQPRFSSIHNLILTPKCLNCHNPTGANPDVIFTDYASTVNTGGVEPFNGAGSDLFKECQSGAMPQGGPPLTGDELSALKIWIDNGALND